MVAPSHPMFCVIASRSFRDSFLFHFAFKVRKSIYLSSDDVHADDEEEEDGEKNLFPSLELVRCDGVE